MIIIVDNYDSFTYNLVQYVRQSSASEVCVFRNDAFDTDLLRRQDPAAIIISPGPGRPEDAGRSRDVVRDFHGTVPILGVCLGHQCIASVFGATVGPAGRLMHGKTSSILHDGKSIFAGIPSPFTATRYHSLIVDSAGFPSNLEISAQTSNGEIMGLRVRDSCTEGVQFHPESILTVEGRTIIRNFIRQSGAGLRLG